MSVRNQLDLLDMKPKELTGLIAGESLWGVLNAGLIVGLSSQAPIGIVGEDLALGPWLGPILFVVTIAWLYGWMLRRASQAR